MKNIFKKYVGPS